MYYFLTEKLNDERLRIVSKLSQGAPSGVGREDYFPAPSIKVFNETQLGAEINLTDDSIIPADEETYAILDKDNVVTNIVVSTYPLNDNWVEIEEGQKVSRGYTYNSGSGTFTPPVSNSKASYSLSSMNVLVNGENASTALTGDYVADINDSVEIQATLADGTAIDYPGAVLKMPITRHSDGKATDDEIYWNATILEGVMTATGTFPRSGDWKFVVSRINDALEKVGADWKMSASDVTFLV